MVTVKPQGAWVLLKLIADAEDRRSRLIVTPGTTDEQLRYGEVLAVGPEVIDLEPGMVVLASWLAGIPAGRDGDYLCRESSVVAIVQQEAA